MTATTALDKDQYDPKKIPQIKRALQSHLSKFDGPFAVLLSGGVDSHAVLFALLDLGKDKRDITVYSARMDTHESRDFRAAVATASAFGLPFRPVVLSSNVDALKRDLLRNVQDMRIAGKIHMESFWVYRKIIDTVKEPYLATGLAGDIYFLLTKTANMHYTDRPDDYRSERFAAQYGPDGQHARLQEYCARSGKTWLSPWLTPAMLATFKRVTHATCNSPTQKQPARDQFAEYFERTRVFGHTDMHGGDSGIKANFEQLLACPVWNAQRNKSVVGVYNRLLRGQITASSPKRPKLFGSS